MAKVDIKMPDEFLERMSRLGKDFDTVAESVLEAGGEVVLQKVQSNLSTVVGSGTKYESRSTGELESALGLTPAKTDKDGNHNVKVGFAEPRSDGGSNAKLAHPGVRQARSACKALSETCEIRITVCLQGCDAAEI